MGTFHSFKLQHGLSSPSSFFTRPAYPPEPFAAPHAIQGSLQRAYHSGHSLDHLAIFPPEPTLSVYPHKKQRTDHSVQPTRSVQSVPETSKRSIPAQPIQAEKRLHQGWNIADIPVFPAPALSQQGQNKTQMSPQKNMTGLPDTLKASIEKRSGLSLDDVRVHFNSAEPTRMHALAYTRGTEIHVGPGQEKYLAHEAWHVVQQMQRRVKPTQMMNNVRVNDNEKLEAEADTIGQEVSRGDKPLLEQERSSFVRKGFIQGTQPEQLPGRNMVLKSDAAVTAGMKTGANPVKAPSPVASNGVVQMVNWATIYNDQGVVRFLNQLRATYHVGNEEEYEFVTLNTWQAQAKKLGYIEAANKAPTQQGGTVGGEYTSVQTKPFVFVNEKLVIQPALKERAIGNIVSTLRHEYEHVQQRNSPKYEYKYKADIKPRGALAEFEAYWVEIVSALREEDTKLIPSDEYVQDAARRARQEYLNLNYDEKEQYKSEAKFLDGVASSFPKSRQERKNLLTQITQKIASTPILSSAVGEGVFDPGAIAKLSPPELKAAMEELEKFRKANEKKQPKVISENLIDL